MAQQQVWTTYFTKKHAVRSASGATSKLYVSSRRLLYESLELRLALSSSSAIESFPTLLGERTDEGVRGLGVSVAIDGDWAVTGAPYDDESGEAAGAAIVYRKLGNQWIFETKLVGSDVDTGEQFGASVAIDNGVIAVGAKTEREHGHDAGAVYVFQFDQGAWTEQAKLVASDAKPENYFGRSVAIEGNTSVVGAEPGHFTYHYRDGSICV